MKYNFSSLGVFAKGEIPCKAAEMFCDEIELRTGKRPLLNGATASGSSVTFVIENFSDAEDYRISHDDNKITIYAHRLRGLIYGYSYFIRKSEIRNGSLFLVKNISCSKAPSMKIRGHQLSYTHMNNTYDAWDMKTYERYIRDLMFFGVNIIEGTSGEDEEINCMMKYSFTDALIGISEICKKFDIDFSVFHPLSKSKSDSETIENMKRIYADVPQLNILFPPGGDPGDLLPEDFVERCKKMKNELNKVFPDIEMWPSAQAPHEYADWGERFVHKMNELPDEIDGLIYGPNHAMPLDEMRRKINAKYPIRFYPDITHNVRCEIPVHFNRDDWHYSLAATLSREAVNPRPSEFRLVHRMTRQYVCGSVSYSEGVNDDLNKMIWSDMDFDFNCNLRESISDYARAFFPTENSEKITDAIFGLEQNWNGDPAENSSIDNTFNIFSSLKNGNPQLMNNWRFVLHLFRAQCDKVVRDRRLFELSLIDEAQTQVYKGNLSAAKKILLTEFPDKYKRLRSELFDYAQRLFNLIGMQLDVEHFHGMSWERGCTLDTIDNPITDRMWLLKKIDEADSVEYMRDIFNRNNVDTDEYYFSFAEHGFDVIGQQTGEYYMNFCGDENADGKLPMCMTKVYDHFNFNCNVAGLTGGDYKLRITYKSRPNDDIIHHRITVNGNVIYDGKQFGGERDENFEKKYLADGFVSVVYEIKKDYLINGCASIEITEPLDGFMFCEFWITKK